MVVETLKTTRYVLQKETRHPWLAQTGKCNYLSLELCVCALYRWICADVSHSFVTITNLSHFPSSAHAPYLPQVSLRVNPVCELHFSISSILLWKHLYPPTGCLKSAHPPCQISFLLSPSMKKASSLLQIALNYMVAYIRFTPLALCSGWPTSKGLKLLDNSTKVSYCKLTEIKLGCWSMPVNMRAFSENELIFFLIHFAHFTFAVLSLQVYLGNAAVVVCLQLISNDPWFNLLFWILTMIHPVCFHVTVFASGSGP